MSEGEPEQPTTDNMNVEKEKVNVDSIFEEQREEGGEKSENDGNNEQKPITHVKKRARELKKEGKPTLGSFFGDAFANLGTSINDDDNIEKDFKNKILDAIRFFNTEYTKTIRGDGDKSNDNRNTEITGITKEAIKQRGQKILTILDDTLGLFSNIDDDNFFNKLNNFIKDKQKVKTLKRILSKLDDENIKQLFDGDHKHTNDEGDNVDVKIGKHGINSLGGKRIKKRTKKNKKSSKKTKTKRNRK